MPRTIHVPQGYSAQLHRATLTYDINALYTDSFTTCNILVLIGTGKVKMLHVDLDLGNGPYIGEAIADLQDLQKIVIINREGSGDIIRSYCAQAIPAPLQSIIEDRKMARELNGVLVTCDKDAGEGIGVKFTYFGMSEHPDNLLHHPDEQTFLAVQKIRQIIGIRETHQTGLRTKREFRLFDGRAWEPLSKLELTVKTGHETTDKEMDFFKKEDPLVVLAGKLMGILHEVDKEGIAILEKHKDLSESVAGFLEGYLHDFDYLLLLKRNLKNMFEHYEGGAAEDKAFRKTALALAEKPGDIVDALEKAVEDYEATPHKNDLKTDVLNEIKMLLKHAVGRKEYAAIDAQRADTKEKAKRLGVNAIQQYKNKQYKDASELYFGAIKLLTQALDKTNPTLATGYYNLGRAMQKLGQTNDALFFLKTALVLQTDYAKTSKKDIAKTQGYINECEPDMPLVSAASRQKPSGK